MDFSSLLQRGVQSMASSMVLFSNNACARIRLSNTDRLGKIRSIWNVLAIPLLVTLCGSMPVIS